MMQICDVDTINCHKITYTDPFCVNKKKFITTTSCGRNSLSETEDYANKP